MNTFIILGPPGAGKGTQADLISADLGIPKISTGDMLRSAVASKSDLGNRVEDILDLIINCYPKSLKYSR